MRPEIRPWAGCIGPEDHGRFWVLPEGWRKEPQDGLLD